MHVRALLRDELEAASSTLALAFDRDPMFEFLLPHPPSRAAWLRWFHLRALREAFALGGAFTVASGPEAAAISIYPPGAWPPSLVSLARAVPFPPGLPPYRLLTAGLPLESRMHALHPALPHVYVYAVGVHPSQRGRGLGGVLLRHAEAIATDAGVALHLETANPDNLPLYRRFGYEVRNEIPTKGGPPLWTMTTERLTHGGATSGSRAPF